MEIQRNIAFMLMIGFSTLCWGQDVIYKTSGGKIDAKIIEVSNQEVKYKNTDYLDGPTFIIEPSEIDSIRYANGSVVNYYDRGENNKNDHSGVMVIKPDPNVEGKSYLDWHNYLDYICIYKDVLIKDYNRIYIAPIDQSKVVFPNKDDNKYPAMINGINNFPDLIREQLIKRIPNLEVVILKEWPSVLEERSLCLQVAFEEINMGSRALRFWVGFGAGAQSVKISGKVFSNIGEELFNFHQKRLSSKGGAQFSYQRVLESEFENLGRDIAKIFLNMEKDKK